MNEMNAWKENFAGKVTKLRTHWEESFEHFANDTLGPVFDEFAGFVSQYDFQASTPQQQPGMRSFKFALGEDAYVLITFKPIRAGEFEFESEFFAPGQGRLDTVSESVNADIAGREWAEERFQDALDRLVTQLTQSAGVGQNNREPAMA